MSSGKKRKANCGLCGNWRPDKKDPDWGLCEPPMPPWVDDGHAHLEKDCDYANECPVFRLRARAKQEDLEDE